MKKKIKKIKSTFGNTMIGCGAYPSGICDGECKEHHSKICSLKYRYRWEFNPSFKEGKQKAYLDKIDLENLFNK